MVAKLVAERRCRGTAGLPRCSWRGQRPPSCGHAGARRVGTPRLHPAPQSGNATGRPRVAIGHQPGVTERADGAHELPGPPNDPPGQRPRRRVPKANDHPGGRRRAGRAMVVIAGTAVSTMAVPSPLSRSSCAWYDTSSTAMAVVGTAGSWTTVSVLESTVAPARVASTVSPVAVTNWTVPMSIGRECSSVSTRVAGPEAPLPPAEPQERGQSVRTTGCPAPRGTGMPTSPTGATRAAPAAALDEHRR